MDVPDIAHRERFELLYRAHRSKVATYLRRRGAADPEALAAETFLTLWRRLHEVSGPELPWLYRTAGYLLANDRRTRAAADRVPGLLAADPTRAVPDPGPEQVFDGALDTGLVEALSRLGPPDREVLLLVAWEDLGGADLAAALGCSRAAARVRLSRARRRLTALLESPAGVGSGADSEPADRTRVGPGRRPGPTTAGGAR